MDNIQINVIEGYETINITVVEGGGGGASQTLAQTLALGNTTGNNNIELTGAYAVKVNNGSKLKQGTDGGIALECAVGYDLQWKEGVSYYRQTGGNIIYADSSIDTIPTQYYDTTKFWTIGSRFNNLVTGITYEATDVTTDNAVWVVVSSGTPGPKGDKGDTGDTGAQGIQGIQGLKGDKGDTGDTGAQGIQGPKGDKGDTGDTGAQGIQGPKGDKGDTGDTGAQGPAGIVYIDKATSGFTPIGTGSGISYVKIIPVGNLAVGDINSLREIFSKAGLVGNAINRWYINTSPSISGAQLISTYTMSSASTFASVDKLLWVKSAILSCVYQANSSSSITDRISNAASITPISIDINVDQYIILHKTVNGAGDTINTEAFQFSK